VDASQPFGFSRPGGTAPDHPGVLPMRVGDVSAGMHTMNGWYCFPRASCLSPEQWDEVRRDYIGKFLELWGAYALNMTRENAIADKFHVSLDMERRIAMPEGDFSHGRLGHMNPAVARMHIYRTELEGLYPSSGISVLTLQARDF
jgi:hypothetical protein